MQRHLHHEEDTSPGWTRPNKTEEDTPAAAPAAAGVQLSLDPDVEYPQPRCKLGQLQELPGTTWEDIFFHV